MARRRTRRRQRDPLDEMIGLTADTSRVLIGLGVASASYKLAKKAVS